jgi:hypothetical protein
MMATANDFDDARRSHGDGAVLRAIDGAKRVGGVTATPYRWRDPKSIPMRPWVYGRQLLRGTVSVLIAPGAAGKTAMLTGVALSLATGRGLLGKTVWGGPKRVWIWNLEDPEEDLSRLVQAAAMHWVIREADIAGTLFVDSAMDGAELKMAVEDREGFRIIEPLMEALTAELIARKIDVLIVDPFVSSHSVNENDNGAIDAIAKKWARVATLAKCCIILSHHSKKMNGVEATSEASRGASALVNAARSAMVLNRMSEEEATRYGVEGEKRRRYFRAYDDKNNRAPPSDVSDWYHLASVDLGNGRDGGEGDSIQVAVPWSPPDTFDGVTVDHLRQVQTAIAAGEWRKSDQADDWAGNAVADVLGLDLGKASDKARVRRLLREWLDSGALAVEERKDSKSMTRPFIVVGRWADDNSPPQRGEVGKGVEVGKPFPTTTAYKEAVGGGEELLPAGVEKRAGLARPVFAEPVRTIGMVLAPGEAGDDVEFQ